MPEKKSEKKRVYSHSKLSTFEQCPLKFKLHYIDRIEPEIKLTIEAHLGRTIHAALEWFYRKILENEIPSIDELISFYTENWQENFIEEIEIVKNYLTEEDYFNKGIRFLADYYQKNYPFDDNTIDIEKEILVNLNEGRTYKLHGFIDRLVYNPKTEEYEIHDYKTTNNIPLKEQIENDRQLALYSIAIKELFGQDKKVKLVWHYLSHNQKIFSERTDEQLEQLKKEVLELIEKIESEKNFFPKISTLCNWCEYKRICPEFNPKNNH